MSRPWKAEHAAPEAFVRSAFDAEAQFVGHGWDCDVWLAKGRAARFPRRRLGIRCLEREAGWLGGIASQLPLDVPEPMRCGLPSPAFPHLWLVSRWVEGSPAIDALEPDEEIVQTLAHLLKELHRIEPPWDAPGDEVNKTDLFARSERTLVRLNTLPEARLPVARAEIVQALRALERTPKSTHACWVHGDLYAQHLIVRGGKLVGVIDWGDLGVSDPAQDLSIAYTWLPSDLREVFWSAYGQADEATRDRAKHRALFYGVALLQFGLEEERPTFTKIGERSLGNALDVAE